jgi:hypothetical protein
MTEQRLNTVAAVAAAVVGGVMLVLLLIGGMFVDEAELRDALDATEADLKADLSAAEGRITTAINESNKRTDAQMEELRGYIIDHMDRAVAAGRWTLQPPIQPPQ